jgi:hypothetical protein
MSERLYGPRPEVQIIQLDTLDEWMESFNDNFSAQVDYDSPDGSGLQSAHSATVSVEQWFEQPGPYQASSYFELKDQMGAAGNWMQQIQGRVYRASSTYMPGSVGGRKEPVLALYDAGIVEQDGTISPIAGGLTVLVRLGDIQNAEIELTPIR